MSQLETGTVAFSLLTGGLATDVGAAAVLVLVDELHAIADGAPRFAEAVELAERLEAFARMPKPVSISPAPRDRSLLLRACDHLCHLGYETSLREVRDCLSELDGVEPTDYRIVHSDDRPNETSTSRSGEYVERDRLVTSTRAQVRVLNVADEGATLGVEDWRPLAWHPTSLGW